MNVGTLPNKKTTRDEEVRVPIFCVSVKFKIKAFLKEVNKIIAERLSQM